MKKIICLILAVSVVFAVLTACSDNGSAGDNTTVSALPVTVDTSVDPNKQAKLEQLNAYDVDIDLNELNNTMLQARVNEILNNPNEYKGQTVRVTGTYTQSYYDQTNKYYDYVIGYDETSCCAAWGIEFMGESVPEDIELYTTVGLVGTFDFYEELGQTYFYINVDHCVV